MAELKQYFIFTPAGIGCGISNISSLWDCSVDLFQLYSDSADWAAVSIDLVYCIQFIFFRLLLPF